MVLTKGICLVAGGVGIGLLVSFAVTRLLASEISGVSVTDPWTSVRCGPRYGRRRRGRLSPARHAMARDRWWRCATSESAQKTDIGGHMLGWQSL